MSTFEQALAEAGPYFEKLILDFCEKIKGKRCLVSSFEVTEKYWGWVESLGIENDRLLLRAKALDERFPAEWESVITFGDNWVRLFDNNDGDGTVSIIGRNPTKNDRYTEWKFTFRDRPAITIYRAS